MSTQEIAVSETARKIQRFLFFTSGTSLCGGILQITKEQMSYSSLCAGVVSRSISVEEQGS